MRILILSRSENIHADAVADYCKQYAIIERINYDFDTSAQGKMPVVSFGKNVPSEPCAVFVHHPRVSCQNEWFEDEIERKLFVVSWSSTKEWMEAKFSSALWVNYPSANQRSRNILRQVQIANSIGLETPETIFTNDVSRLRIFADKSTVVIKQGNLGVHIDGKRILTSIVDIDSISAGMLQGCPCLFQKYVPKQFELRIHVIGETVLTCKIDSQASSKTRIDWRNYDIENTPHAAYSLNDAISKQCVLLTKRMGLEFGVIDMVVTPQGQHVFLECNAQGHWIWIEELTGLPITRTLCEHILNSSA